MTATKPLLAVLSSGDRRYREYIVAALARRWRLWLVDSKPATWQSRYLTGSSVVDPNDASAVAAALTKVPASQGPVAGLVCYDEWRVATAAEVTEVLGLPGPAVAAVRACRDKALTRARLRHAGVPQPRSMKVPDYAAASVAANSVGYPVIVKARAMAGSIGVVRVEHPEDLTAAWAAADVDQDGTVRGAPVLIEEYLDGPEISIDAAVYGGQAHIVALAHKHLEFAPFFEEVGHTVSADDPLLTDQVLLDQLHQIHAALGLDHLITHSEFRLTSSGPRLVEVNARLGGDFIPHLGHLATGIDASVVAGELASGQEPELEASRHRVAGIRFLYPSAPCRVIAVEPVPPAERPAAVCEVTVTGRAGQDLRLPPDAYLSRYAHVVAVADDLVLVEEALRSAEQLVSLRSTPL